MYRFEGTDRHANGDSGKWFFTLTVKPVPITLIQGIPTAATVSVRGEIATSNATSPLPEQSTAQLPNLWTVWPKMPLAKAKTLRGLTE